MEVKEAVRVAKAWVSEVFAEEHVHDIGLEETVFEESSGRWLITVGFRRRIGRAAKLQDQSVIDMLRAGQGIENRCYKVVLVDDKTGKVIEMRDRLLREAA